MKKFATISNGIYVIAFAVHAYFMSVVAIPLLILGGTSAMYHYLYAREHAGLNVDSARLKLYQRLDVASIYLVLGVYPFQLAGGWWALFLLPCIVFALQKIFGENAWDSHKIIPVLSIVVLALTWYHRSFTMFIGALVAMGAAVAVSYFADKFLAKGDSHSYDSLHAQWHHYSGFAFIIVR